MTACKLEHVNFTVRDTRATAAWMGRVFGWRVRWEGPSLNDGWTAHVGDDAAYVAIYNHGTPGTSEENNYETVGGLNHVAVVTDDLDAVEARVRAEGFAPHSHADYEPGRRFYFNDADGIEYEVVSYA